MARVPARCFSVLGRAEGTSGSSFCAGGDGTAAGRYQSLLPADGLGVEILLQRVPEGKDRKNRVPVR
jgi:hypothetical protein